MEYTVEAFEEAYNKYEDDALYSYKKFRPINELEIKKGETVLKKHMKYYAIFELLEHDKELSFDTIKRMYPHITIVNKTFFQRLEVFAKYNDIILEKKHGKRFTLISFS